MGVQAQSFGSDVGSQGSGAADKAQGAASDAAGKVCSRPISFLLSLPLNSPYACIVQVYVLSFCSILLVMPSPCVHVGGCNGAFATDCRPMCFRWSILAAQLLL